MSAPALKLPLCAHNDTNDLFTQLSSFIKYKNAIQLASKDEHDV